MRIRLIPFTLSVAVGAMSLSSCSTAPSRSHDEALLSADDSTTPWDNLNAERPTGFVRYMPIKDKQMARVRLRDAYVKDVLVAAFPGMSVVPGDDGVSLFRPVTIDVEGLTQREFFDALRSLSGYHFEIVGNTIRVSSEMEKEWLLPTLAAKAESESSIQGGTGGSSSGGSSGSGGGSRTKLSAGFTGELDEWDSVIEQAERILGATSEEILQRSALDSAGTVVDRSIRLGAVSGPRLVAIRSLGLIRAYGSVSVISELDRFLSSVASSATKQVRLDARFIEVSFDDSKARGINWGVVMNRMFSTGGAVGFNFGFDSLIPGGGNEGQFGVGIDANLPNGDVVTSLLQLLGRYGDVSLRDEPQVLTLNGRTAYLSSGEEFGYVSSITSNSNQGILNLTPTLERILIGVEIAVTPRVLEDGRIYMEIVPVVSNFRGFDNFSIDGNQFSQPRVTLKQMATQVIARSGQPIPLGGLKTTRIENELRTLPSEKLNLLGLEKLFESERRDTERRELMLVVTPHLVEV